MFMFPFRLLTFVSGIRMRVGSSLVLLTFLGPCFADL
uniref:Uncharacterized protein n=1 Tax=Arundo donax TaxID=35708 RepID=A0A0A9H0A0_ARUDO